jgi:RNA polymerase sigma-70 factor (sigma-E family)
MSRVNQELDFHDFVVSRGSELLRIARLLASNSSTAEDLVQTTLLHAWRSWHSVQAAEDRDAYVRRIMVNAATSSWRRRSEYPVANLPHLPAGDGYQGVEDRDHLLRALDRLPARQRAAVVLRYFSDLNDARIADALRCSEPTVRSLISRALTSLRVREATPAPLAQANPRKKEG